MRTAEGAIQSWLGTCSTKHDLLLQILHERWPDVRPRLIHRVYRADKTSVREIYGPEVAAAVPEDGLVDVHRYMVIILDGRDVTIDVTFPSARPWDGRSSMPLACGDGQDFPAGINPDREKSELETQHCDPAVREPFIAALAGSATASHA